MDVFERRKMLIELSKPDVSPETIEKYRKLMDERPIEERYGEIQEFSKDKVWGEKTTFIDASCGDEQFSGQRAEAVYNGERVPYYITESWLSGKMIRVDEAYRIFEETEDKMKVRKVKDMSELECIAKGLIEVIRKFVSK